jgi:hypothetical protein
MVFVSSIILILIFVFLSALHVYWAFGGRWGSGAVIPTKDDHTKPTMPGAVPTLIVALGLLSFGGIVWMNMAAFNFTLPLWLDPVRQYGLWVIAGIFTLRAVGEFNYVGFFKKYKHTKFAINDTKYYSPLCLVIGVLALVVAVGH